MILDLSIEIFLYWIWLIQCFHELFLGFALEMDGMFHHFPRHSLLMHVMNKMRPLCMMLRIFIVCFCLFHVDILMMTPSMFFQMSFVLLLHSLPFRSDLFCSVFLLLLFCIIFHFQIPVTKVKVTDVYPPREPLLALPTY